MACVEKEVLKVKYLHRFSHEKPDHWQMLETANSPLSRRINLWKMTHCTCIDREVRFS